MRIAVLWINLTGYLNASLRELNRMPGVEPKRHLPKINSGGSKINTDIRISRTAMSF